MKQHIEGLAKWILERHNIYLRRMHGMPKPWTEDKILQRYRFCNVYRELDTVTKWIAEHWREPNATNPYLWFAMAVARYINWPETLDAFGFPVPWDKTLVHDAMRRRAAKRQKVFTGAYIVSTNGEATDKTRYVVNMLDKLWKHRDGICEAIGLDMTAIGVDGPPLLQTTHTVLMSQNGVGSFMAGQVVADLKYAAPYSLAADWYVWAASGPGSRRGLNRVCGRDVDTRWNEAEWLVELQKLQLRINPLVEAAGFPALHAQDLQNCLCEFDKYERVRLNQGRPRSLYPGV